MNNIFKESNEKQITIGDYAQLFGKNEKSKITIINACDEDVLFNDRIDYLQYTSEGVMHDLCNLEIDCFTDTNEIYVDAPGYSARRGVY